jgi:hypothetical protein
LFLLLVAPRAAQAAIIAFSTFEVAPQQGEAITWAIDRVYAATGDTIYSFDLHGNPLSAFPSPGSVGQDLERGLAFDGTHLWLFDRYRWTPTESTFYKLSLDGTVVNSFPAPPAAANLFGLVWDGANLVGADFTGRRLHKISTNGELIESIATGASVMGLAFDGSAFVTFDPRFPLGPLAQAYVKLDPKTGEIIGVVSRQASDPWGHVFTSRGDGTLLFRHGFTSRHGTFSMTNTEFEPYTSVVPEPPLLAIALAGILTLSRRFR